MLVDYLRDHLELRGTKYMCREGGCGACCVSVVKCAGGPVLAVNSCMISITSCQNWEITTIEEIGNRKKGYNVLQKTLAEYNGTQCGYCTPAWIQNMYSLLQNDNKPTMLDIEKSFAGNVCRCTGYRPILEAFKKFGRDAPKEDRIMDIEDLHICKKTGLSCHKEKYDDDEDWCILSNDVVKETRFVEIELKDNKFWYKVYDLKTVFDILNDKGYCSYMLVYGNTAKDISSVPELKGFIFDQNLIVGVGITLNELLDIFKATSKYDYFGYLQKFVEHINLVANIPIRNLGSVGGNLMIKHQHNEFTSDIFLLFETVGAYLTIYTCKGVSKKLSMQQFLKEDMRGKIIVDVMLPPLDDQYKLVTYKIMPRSQNAHAIVHAGFLYKLSSENRVLEARLAYGGLSPAFIRAEATEKFLVGKPLFSNTTLQSALNILESELVVVPNPPDPSGLLSLCPNCILNSRFISGTTKIHDTRPISEARQIFDTNPSLWPLNQPIPKVEALIQCVGEAKYSADLPTQPREVYAAFVLSTVAVGDIVRIDASRALKQPSVLAFYTVDDIPGENSFTPKGTLFFTSNEEVLSNGKVVYFNQPIGIIVAETQQIANKAAKMVTASYKNVRKPVIDIKEAKNDASRLTLFTSKAPTEKGTDVVKTIKGQNTIYGQVHFTMENLSCVTLPTEEGLEVHITSQWMDGVQVMISKALNIEANRIDVYVRRLGGGFGLKFSRCIQTAIACSLVVQKLNRPCRLCEVNATGVIQSIVYRQYEDNGYKIDETLTLLGADVYNNCYTNTKWDFAVYDAITDTAKNSWCRSPGSLESIALAEHVVERISYELSLDPFDVRIANVDTTKYNDLIEMAENLKKTASYTERKVKVAKFNSENRWRKRGLRVSFLRWTPVGNSIFYVNLSVCHSDGTVIITHGGIEMGQGINTKAVQICAYYFKIPIEKIQIKGNNSIIAPNCFATGGSIGSQNVGLGVRRCCEAMLERLSPIRSQLDNPTWLELILKAYESDVELQTHSYVGAKDVFTFDIFGVAIAESEIDVLTGEFEVIRVDILQDVGQSVSPEIDVDLVYNRTTGELLSDRTWNYYVPLARDIPQDFRVAFRKKSYGVEQILGSKSCILP
ncbi:Aldehyde oxidase AOX1 [Operophtera brumata]|uniref:Aldehyde oxidase AOX1 n=1 Tax=Operophtera brumata TaxID=104452 RepID=A0A0L7L4E9_OPEBR|nr:Aldehyde oxidase AOX1 [Operophtera brumata]